MRTLTRTAVIAATAVLASTLLAGTAHADHRTACEPITCDQYELYSDGRADPVADCLIARGYRGLPDDGKEALYAPRRAMEWCIDTYGTVSA